MIKLCETEERIERILCVLCALCGEKFRTAKHAESAKLPYVRFNIIGFYTHERGVAL